MRRILIIAPSASLHGGVETILHDLCRHLPEYGWKAVLGLTAARRSHDVDRYRAAAPDLPIHSIWSSAATPGSRQNAIRTAVELESPDIVLAARIGDTYEAVREMKAGPGAPRLAVAVRGLEAQYLFDVCHFAPIVDLCIVDGILLERACLRLTDVEPERVVSIPGGVRTPLVDPRPRRRTGRLAIGYVGRLTRSDKRSLDLLTLVKHLAQEELPFTLDVAGSGPEEEPLRAGLKQYEAVSEIRFHGWLDHSRLYRTLYPKIDCMLNFSPTEGVTISPREGLVHGVVPVLSAFPGLRLEGQFRDEENALVFPVGNMEAACRCLLRLYREPALLERLSRNAIQSQEGKYSFRGSIEAWSNSLDRCMAQPLKMGKVPGSSRRPAGRREQRGGRAAAADRLRVLMARTQSSPSDPGAEWPHGHLAIPPDGQTSLEAFARETEDEG